MKKNPISFFIVILLISILNINCSGKDILNKPLFKFKKVLFHYLEDVSYYDIEFVNNEEYVYSDSLGFNLGNIKTGKINYLFKFEGIDYEKGETIYKKDNKSIKQPWGQIDHIQRIDDNIIYFQNGTFNHDYYGFYILDIRTLEYKYLGRSQIYPIGSRPESVPLKNQPKNFDMKILPEHRYPLFFDPEGKYVFAYYYDEKNRTNYNISLLYDIYRYDIDVKNEKLLLENMYLYKWTYLGDGLYAGSFNRGVVIFDNNGNILQWYYDMKMVGNHSLTPDGKNFILLGGIMDVEEDENGIKNVDLIEGYGGILLFELDNEVKKVLIERSKELSKLSDKERLYINGFFKYNNFNNSYKEGAQTKYMVRGSIYKVSIREDLNIPPKKRIYYTPKVEGLRLRIAPSTDSKVMRSLKIGEKLKLDKKGKEEVIDGIKGNWIRVYSEQEGDLGWCFDAYLKEVK